MRGGKSYSTSFKVQGRGGNDMMYRSRGVIRRGNRGGGVRCQMNPVGENGEVQTCKICNSIFHFTGYKGENCPESYDNQQKVFQVEGEVEDVDQCNSVEIELNEVFQMQANDEGVLDSACTSNVMGRKWTEAYINRLNIEDVEVS